MSNWISENIGNIIAIVILAAVIAAIVIHLIKQKKRGKSSCGCSCGSCPMKPPAHPNSCRANLKQKTNNVRPRRISSALPILCFGAIYCN